MQFANLQLVWLTALIPVFGWMIYAMASRRNRRLNDEYGESRLIERFSQPLSRKRLALKAVSFSACLACLVLALARPTVESGRSEFPMGTIDVVALVDVSRSMAVPDYKGKLPEPFKAGRRLDMAKYLVLNELIGSLNYNRLGVVTYAGSAFPQAFLSDDLPALKWVLSRAVSVGSAPGEGSELAKAFELAFTLFDLDSGRGHRRVIVLFSYGGNDSSLDDINAVVSELQKRDIDLIVVGLGKTQPSAIPSDLLSQQDQYFNGGKPWYEKDGQIVTSRLEENTLLLLKNKVQGRYVRVEEAKDFSMTTMVSRMEVKYKHGQYEFFPWLLMAAFGFFVIGLLAVSERKPRAIKKKPQINAKSDKGGPVK